MDNQIGIVITGTNNSIAAFERLKGDLDAVAVSAKTVTESQKAMATQGRDATTTQRELATPSSPAIPHSDRTLWQSGNPEPLSLGGGPRQIEPDGRASGIESPQSLPPSPWALQHGTLRHLPELRFKVQRTSNGC